MIDDLNAVKMGKIVHFKTRFRSEEKIRLWSVSKPARDSWKTIIIVFSLLSTFPGKSEFARLEHELESKHAFY